MVAYDLSEYPSPFIKNEKFDGILVVGDNAPADDVIALTNIVRSLIYPILGADPETVSALDTLMEKQTKTYTISGVDYEVTLNYINSNSAQIIVNGQTTKILSIGDSDTLADGTAIALADIFFENDVYSATIFFAKRKITVTKTKVETGGAKLASEVRNIKSVNSILIGHACDNELISKVKEAEDCASGYEPNTGFIEAYEFPNDKVSIIVTGDTPKDISNAARVLSFYGHYKNNLKGNKIKIVEAGNELKVIPVSKSPAITKPKTTETDFTEIYFKLGILVFILLIMVLIGLIFRKKPKTRQKAHKV